MNLEHTMKELQIIINKINDNKYYFADCNKGLELAANLQRFLLESADKKVEKYEIYQKDDKGETKTLAYVYSYYQALKMQDELTTSPYKPANIEIHFKQIKKE